MLRAAVGGGAVEEAAVPYEFEYGGQVEQGGDAAGVEQEEQPVIPRFCPLYAAEEEQDGADQGGERMTFVQEEPVA